MDEVEPPAYDDEKIDDTFSKLDPSVALEALNCHIEKNCCWGKGPMKKMEIADVLQSTAYTVKIEREMFYFNHS